jgi:hypothetical protein
MLLLDVLQKYCNIYCISLEERNDRYNLACAEFKKVDLFNYVHFHRPKRHPKGGVHGNFDSILYCLKHSLQLNNKKLIVIFEDDVCFSVNMFLKSTIPSTFIENTELWDTIRLGYWKGIFIHLMEESYSENGYNLYRGNGLATHAFILSPVFAEKFLHHSKGIETYPFGDWYLTQISGRHYLYQQALCYQRPGMTTDIQWHFEKIQHNFLMNPIKFQIKYQKRTYRAWNLIGRFINNVHLSGLLQSILVFDFIEFFRMIRGIRPFYVFENKCLLDSKEMKK